MNAVRQYLLNLRGKNFKYTGSGTVYVSGTASFIIRPKYGEMTVRYGINEYVYDSEHHIWQITAVYGTPDAVYYVAFNGQYERVFREDELISFMDGSKYFNNKYSQDVNSLASRIAVIDEKISITPDIEPTTSKLIHQFSIGEFVYDYNRNIWQVIAIQNNVDLIEYVVMEKGSNIIATFGEEDLLSFSAAITYFDSQDETNVDSLTSQISYIDELINTTPVIPISENKLLVKFSINQFVYDANHTIWKILAIQHNTITIQYLANNGFLTKLFDQDELTDFVDEAPHFISKYDSKISEYAEKISAIQAIIAAKYG